MSFNFTKRIDIYNGKNALRNPQCFIYVSFRLLCTVGATTSATE